MWPIIAGLLRSYAPYITLPVAGIVGFIGYHIEDILSDKHTPSMESIKQQREERLLENERKLTSLKEKQFVPKTIFEKNLSPSLQEPPSKQSTQLKEN